jgi:hypothetical protein
MTKPAALSFSSHQDAVDFANRRVEESRRILALGDFSLLKAYVEGRAYAVVQMLSDKGASKYDLDSVCQSIGTVVLLVT